MKLFKHTFLQRKKTLIKIKKSYSIKMLTKENKYVVRAKTQ